jgi:phosphoribosylaminoimidazole-succinocarboxamide synthase
VNTVAQTHVKGYAPKRGKVRDIYDLGDELLIVATDRVSVFDCVLPTPIPQKGRVLTALSRFWFGFTEAVIDNHLISLDLDGLPPAFQEHREALAGRSMRVRKAKVFPVECVARGYLAGSAWKEYQETGSYMGMDLPPDLLECSPLPEPIFTPATKAESGHDENITFDRMCSIVGRNAASRIQSATLELYRMASEYAAERGIIIADTKFEFGTMEGELIVIDEMLTPDSSRFWPADSYEPGRPQASYDKQFVRDFAEGTGWNKTPPAPELPDEIVNKTTEKYLEAYSRLVGEELDQAPSGRARTEPRAVEERGRSQPRA